MLFNLDFADKIMEHYNLDALIAVKTQTLKYLGFDFWYSTAEEWMVKPGGNDKNAIINFCIIPHNRKPVYILAAMSLDFLKDFNRKDFGQESPNYEIVLFGQFNNLDEYEKSTTGKFEFLNESEQKISKLMIRDGVFDNSFTALYATLDKLNLGTGKIGLETGGISEKTFGAIKKKLESCSIFRADELFRLVRMIKTGEEIKIIEKCSEINETALLKSIETLKNSGSLADASTKYKKVVFEESALFEHYIVGSYGLGNFNGSDYQVGKKMVFGLDTGAVYKNYTSDTGLTIFTGDCNKKYSDEYQKILEVISAGVNSTAPGVKCSAIYKNMEKIKDKHGLSNLSMSGHGIGLSFTEYPKINENLNYSYNDGFSKRSADFFLEKDMVFNLEVTSHDFGEKTIHIEKTLFVTENGFKELKFQDRSKPVNIKI
jgi:Xaa-Pro dipeptidase